MTRKSVFLAYGLVTLALVAVAGADTLSGRVVGITDGDTIAVLDNYNVQHVIRLGGIDAPEHDQAFGTSSKQNLSRMLFEKLSARIAAREAAARARLAAVWVRFVNLSYFRSRNGRIGTPVASAAR